MKYFNTLFKKYSSILTVIYFYKKKFHPFDESDNQQNLKQKQF